MKRKKTAHKSQWHNIFTCSLATLFMVTSENLTIRFQHYLTLFDIGGGGGGGLEPLPTK